MIHEASLLTLAGTFVLVLLTLSLWFAYVLAMLFLLVRPQGLLGAKVVDRA